MKPNVLLSTKTAQIIMGIVTGEDETSYIVKNAAYVLSQTHDRNVGIMLIPVVFPDFFVDSNVPDITISKSEYRKLTSEVNDAWVGNYNGVFNRFRPKQDDNQMTLSLMTEGTPVVDINSSKIGESF
jgi:hypothetical protein